MFVLLIFYLKHSQSNVFFFNFYFTRRLRHLHRMWRMINFQLNRLQDQLRSAGHSCKQTNDLYSHSSES